MTDTKNECDLCGLNVEISGFTLKTKEGDKVFCCEGCKGIYQLLKGMTCASCALLIEMVLKRDPRVKQASVNFGPRR